MPLKKTLLLLPLALLFVFGASSQSRQLDIILNKNILQLKDTLDLQVNYTLNGERPASATLFMMAVNEDGMIWEKRWPVLKGFADPGIIIPDSMQEGRYRLYFLILQDFFTVKGKVLEPEKQKLLKTTLITSSGDVLEKDVPVDPDGSFSYKNVLFEKEATLFFKKTSGRNDDLNIQLETVLDSVFFPAVTLSKDIYIGKPTVVPDFENDILTASDPARMNLDSLLTSKAHMLDVVVVEAKAQSRAQKYNEKYSSGMFKSSDERIIDMMEAPPTFQSALQYLQGRVAGLQIRPDPRQPFNFIAIWRSEGVVFYLDEMRVDAQTISTIPVTDIAIVKAYPPPFFGNPGGGGGAIAVYTKRGGEDELNSRHTFRVKGYTPMLSQFSLTPDKF